MIRQATLEDTACIEEILADAVKWMKEKKIPNLWNQDSIKWEALSKHYKIEDFYLAFIDNEPAGCMAITDYDTVYWPKIRKGTSLYLHKLAVKRKFAGNNISNELIEQARQMARERKIHEIRLDCNADRTKLRLLYEKQGFHWVKDVQTKSGYKLSLYCNVIKDVVD